MRERAAKLNSVMHIVSGLVGVVAMPKTYSKSLFKGALLSTT